MKKYFSSTVFVLSLIFLFSCGKETRDSNEPDESKAIRTELIKEIQNLPKSLVGLGYRKLNSPEKVIFWNTHVDKYLSTHTVSEKLRQHIDLLRGFATPTLYDQLGTAEMDMYVADFTKKWYTIPVNTGLFSAKELIEIATLVGVGKDEVNVSPLPLGGSGCNCYYNISCGSNRYCYENDYCNTYGPMTCGVFGTSRCDGTCDWERD